MNANVQAGPLTISLRAEIVDVKVSADIIIPVDFRTSTDMTCLPNPTVISINGHSLSAVNPNKTLLGGKATLIAA